MNNLNLTTPQLEVLEHILSCYYDNLWDDIHSMGEEDPCYSDRLQHSEQVMAMRFKVGVAQMFG